MEDCCSPRKIKKRAMGGGGKEFSLMFLRVYEEGFFCGRACLWDWADVLI
jgi:hypothetical protein